MRPAPPPRERRDRRDDHVVRDEPAVVRDERTIARDERVGHEDRVSRQPQRGDGFGEGGFGEGIAAGGDDSAGEERSAGEARGRRRRGRRGGRRRTGRGEGVSDSDRRDDGRRDDRLGHPAGDASAREDSPIHDRAPSHDDDIDIVDERALSGGEEGSAGEGESRSSDESGEPPRRRRRRGRRGGRRRRGREEGGGEAAAAGPRGVSGRHGEAGERPTGRRDDHDEEPLPAGYGVVRPPKPAAKPAGEGGAGERTDREGDSGERGRRRRKRGGRRRSERSGEERRSSGTGRRIRSDFAPVAGSFDEDDEGLEFLGLEEAGKSRPRREPVAGEEDVLVESGLSEVLDVPSWVEAIGIVIAGNLDARSRHREDRGR
jgi:ribonuclease E